MPKFMTYQRPAPVNKSAWGGGKAGGNPPQPVRRLPAAPGPHQPASALPILPTNNGRGR